MTDSNNDILDSSKLSEACCGDLLKIIDIDSNVEDLLRVQAMGICRGRMIEVQKAHDPMIIKVHQTRIALATSLASRITVERC